MTVEEIKLRRYRMANLSSCCKASSRDRDRADNKPRSVIYGCFLSLRSATLKQPSGSQGTSVEAVLRLAGTTESFVWQGGRIFVPSFLLQKNSGLFLLGYWIVRILLPF